MRKISRISAITLMVISILALGLGPVFADNGEKADTRSENSELPVFRPSIADKMSYAKFYEPPQPSIPLDKTEIADIVFSRGWLLKNDMDSCSDIIMITFPTTWLSEPPEVTGSNVIHLRLPMTMLKMNNSSKDPNQVTLSLSSSMFNGYSDPSEEFLPRPATKQNSAVENDGISTRAIEYQDRYWYYKTVSSIIKAEGIVRPYSYENDGESFLSYHEREIYTDANGDVIEIISEFQDTGDIYVWVAVWDDGTWNTSRNWLLVDVEEMQEVEYYCYLLEDNYYFWLEVGEDWYYKSYADSDPTEFRWLVGSTEIDTIGGVVYDFEVITYPISTSRVGTDSSWYDTEDAFQYSSADTDDPYVSVTGYFDASGGLVTIHSAYDE